MNKYQDSLDNFVKALSHFTNFKSIHDWKSDLQELVDKATPYKIQGNGLCKCGARVLVSFQGYCTQCGQAIDWSNE